MRTWPDTVGGMHPAALSVIDAHVEKLTEDLVALRRDLHAHPELGRAEVRTTRVVHDLLTEAGLSPVLLQGTGLLCDIGGSTGERVALRADLDALPVPDEKDLAYRSTVPGICHACGHDVHTAVLVGAGLALAAVDRQGLLPHPVRLVFQPAEEIMRGGALDVIAAGGLDGVRKILALHCDPSLPVGRVGLRVGPITSACDVLYVRLRGRGGHTARPHASEDMVYALGVLATQLPAVLSRRVDPRAGLTLVWGRISAGVAPNTMPSTGELHGTLRCLEPAAWVAAPDLLPRMIDEIVAPYGVRAEVELTRGVPPVDNHADAVRDLARAAATVVAGEAVVETGQSLGGEDFAWYLEHVPGAMARLGTATPGEEGGHDLHRGTFDIDESAIAVGVQLLAAAALAASDNRLG